MRSPYTPEQDRFIRANLPGRSWEEFTGLFNAHFGENRTMPSLRSHAWRLRVSNGRCGALDAAKARTLPVGTVRDRSEGTLYVKTESGEWVPQSVVNWEAENGKLPDGCTLIHLDGDRKNNDPSNLAVIDKRARPKLSALLHEHEGIQRETAVAMATIDRLVKDKTGAAHP